MLFFAFILAACQKEEEAEATPGAGSLSLDTPEQGDFLEADTSHARGTAEHVTALTINGAATKINDGHFDAKIELQRGVNVVEAVAETEGATTLYVRNGVLAGNYRSASDEVEDAVVLRVNEGGLRAIGDLAEEMLSSDLVNDSLAGMNPVYSDSYGVWGWDAVTIAANVDGVYFDTPSFEFEPRDGVLELTATLPNLYVDIYAWGEAIGFDFESDVALWASSAVLTADVEIDTRGGKLDVNISNTAVTLNDFGYDTSLLPGDVESYLLVETIRDTITETLVEQIDAMVPALLDDTLAGLDPSYTTDLMGLDVQIEFAFAKAEIDRDGLQLALDLDVAVPPTGTKSGPGFLGADMGTPDVDTEADVAGAISDDLLNRVLYEAWAGGLLDMTLSTADGSLEPLVLVPFGVTEGSIEVEALLPPVVVENDGQLEAQIGELLVTIDAKGSKLGDHLKASVNVFVGLEVEIEDGELVLSLGEPRLSFMVRETSHDVSNETMTNVLEEALPIDSILALLGDFAFPLPELYGIRLDKGTASRDESGVYTGIEIGVK
ncbi:MAG: hypothetical protein FJ090_18450 [Deltaproteobacteria bacterium]|nr:hypothetical protein [Deltaproteobacteria bacterium]